MGVYENLVSDCEFEIIETDKLPSVYDGYYYNGKIFIKPNLSETRKAEVLYEELSHHKLTYGNITDQSQFNNRKFERYAVRDSYECALPLHKFVDAHQHHISNLFEFADYVQLSERYVLDVIEHYKLKYGLSTFCGDYLIRFEPLEVFKYTNY
jgi:hypothetical protein